MSRSYAPTELKRRLKPALEELEQLGFLEPLSPEERYSYVKRGCWRIIFIRGARPSRPTAPPAPQRPRELVEALKARGVTAKTAAELVETPPAGPDPDQDRGLRLAACATRTSGSARTRPATSWPRSGPTTRPRATSSAPDVEAKAQAGRAGGRRGQACRSSSAPATRPTAPKAREAELRAAWERLPEAEREAILAAVKAENPGLGRWKNMLEPLCLAALEARLKASRAGRSRLLFPDE